MDQLLLNLLLMLSPGKLGINAGKGIRNLNYQVNLNNGLGFAHTTALGGR